MEHKNKYAKQAGRQQVKQKADAKKDAIRRKEYAEREEVLRVLDTIVQDEWEQE